MLAMNMLMSILCASGGLQGQLLTPEEERVIVRKGTEYPFTGKYYDHFEPGVYRCRRCNVPLYRSESKFHSGCGWPSFDDEIPGAVRRVPDADGHRTEIVCARCDAHLGHVFLGEGLTPNNTRHCVNSVSLVFEPMTSVDNPLGKYEIAVFAGGCFWGVEHYLRTVKGVVSTRVGYTGGKKDNPSYEQVCRGVTGHAESVEVVFDPEQTSFETLARLFFELHDPTQLNRQGPDKGTQYRSAVFYTSDVQKETTLHLVETLRAKGFDVVTEVSPASIFWPAEDYHQRYFERRGIPPACHTLTKRF